MNKKKECAVIDTCVLLDDPDFIVRASRIGFPIITNITFKEIDYNKNSGGLVSKNARLIIRTIKHQTPNTIDALPCGKSLKKGDTLRNYEFDGAPLFVLSRDRYHAQNGPNDAKIREVAKDYDLILVTEDGGNKILADVDGIRAVTWAPEKQNTPKIQPFKPVLSVVKSRNPVKQPIAIPTEGDFVKIGPDGHSVKLGCQIGAGGEGIVFEVVDDSRVAKVYHSKRLTANRIAKLQLMASRAVSKEGLCWPEQLVYTSDECAVGYVTQRAYGFPLQTSVFIKPLLLQKFPDWQRNNLVNVCIAFLEHLQQLHALNVLVGDINPLNVLVDGDGSSVFMVDVDSFQIEGYPCPVGTVNFSPPTLQNRDFKTTLRSVDDELFAIATMLFMILLPGKPPYSQQGGEAQRTNIIEANFPYPLGSVHRGKKVSPGPWGHIWSHLPYRLKELFHKAFRENERISISEWLDALQAYKYDISKGYLSNDIFPMGFKVPKGQGEQVTCARQGCGQPFEMHRDKVAELNAEGRPLYCPKCLQAKELERLAKPQRPQIMGNRATASFSERSAKPTNPRNKKKQTTSGNPWLGVLIIVAVVVLGTILGLGWLAIVGILVVLVVSGLLLSANAGAR